MNGMQRRVESLETRAVTNGDVTGAMLNRCGRTICTSRERRVENASGVPPPTGPATFFLGTANRIRGLRGWRLVRFYSASSINEAMAMGSREEPSIIGRLLIDSGRCPRRELIESKAIGRYLLSSREITPSPSAMR